MKKMLLLISSMFFVGMAYFCNAGQGFDFPSLPKDMQYEIMLKYIDDAIAGTKTLLDAENKIKNLTVINKDPNLIINESVFCLKLIKKLAQKFNASDEKLANASGLKCIKEHLKLQKEFMNFLLKPSSNKIVAEATFNNYLRRGVDLEWTKGMFNDIKTTPLMEVAGLYKLDALRLLLSKGVKVNYANPSKHSALFFAATMFWMEHEEREKIPTERIIEVVKALLAAGASPSVSGLNTPSGLERIPRKEVRDLIEAAQK